MYTIDESLKDYHDTLAALRKYNMLAYKKVIFDIMTELHKGNLLGSKDGNTYAVDLPCDTKFKSVYGQVKLIYEVQDKRIIMKSIEPARVMKAMHSRIVKVYNGIPIIDSKDLFKAKLLGYMEG